MANNWVYFIYDPDIKRIKIGQSWNPVQRLAGIRGHGHNKAEIIAIIPAHSVEKELHEQFSYLRAEGEWFNVDDNLLNYIQESQRLPPIIIKETSAPIVNVIERIEQHTERVEVQPAPPPQTIIEYVEKPPRRLQVSWAYYYAPLIIGLVHFLAGAFLVGVMVTAKNPTLNFFTVSSLIMIFVVAIVFFVTQHIHTRRVLHMTRTTVNGHSVAIPEILERNG